MPLTAYSISAQKEEDVGQVLRRLSESFGEAVVAVDAIPQAWHAFMRTDLQCPCCFVTGAELVNEALSKATKKPVRQACFRFGNPRHREHCDFNSTATANTVPENLVSFSESKSNLTRAVRELVCTGIEQGVFSQVSIRNMREWFFNKKVESLFVVTLDPRLYSWISSLQEAGFRARGSLPKGVALTPEIAAMPDFDWRAEAARRVVERYPQHQENMAAIFSMRVAMFGDGGKRAEAMAQRYQGRHVFDPTVLADEYRKTCALADFIGHNYAPLKAAKGGSGTVSVLAFSALLLFVRRWDITQAIADFTKIAAAAGHSNQDLGNVMGLNPFLDYEAWRILKQMQDLNITVPENVDVKAERVVMEVALRAQFGAPPMPV